MRLAHHLQRHPSGMWHFRLNVPRDLQAVLGLRYIKKSLCTRDPAVARIGAYVLSAKYAQLFARARGAGAVIAKDGKKAGDPIIRTRKREMILRTGSGIEILDYVCRINADGSASIEANGPEDHALAMEAWTEMAEDVPAFLRRKEPTFEPEDSSLRSARAAAPSPS